RALAYFSEFPPVNSRGYWASWLDVGSSLGFAAGAGTVAITTVISTSIAGENAMLDGGWRIPFLVALPLGAVAIWFRLKIPETPSFEANEDAGLITKDR